MNAMSVPSADRRVTANPSPTLSRRRSSERSWRLGLSLWVCATLLAMSAGADSAPEFLLKWGTQGVGNGQFEWVSGVSVDTQGLVYVTDQGLNRIQVFTSDSLFVRAIGSGGTGPGQFRWLTDCAIDPSGIVYALDNRGTMSPLPAKVEVFDPNGQFVKAWDLPLSNASFRSLALSPDGTTLYVAWSYQLLKMSTDGVLIKQWSYLNTNNYDYGGISGVAVGPSGAVYTALINRNLVAKYSSEGELLGVIGSGGSEPSVIGVATDASERLYLCGSSGQCLMYGTAGDFIAAWGTPGAGDGELSYAFDIAVDSGGNIFVADARARMQKFGFVGTPARRGSWGQLKRRFR